MRLIFLTGAGGRAQSAARFPCGVLTVIPRIESRTFRWMMPTALVPSAASALQPPSAFARTAAVTSPSRRDLPRTTGTTEFDDFTRPSVTTRLSPAVPRYVH